MSGVGGKPHTEVCRRRIMQCMADSDDPKYKDKLETWFRKVCHYLEVTETAYNTVMFTDASERHHPEPTSPAVQASPDVGNETPRLVENEMEENATDVADDNAAKTNPAPKVKKTLLKLKMSRQQWMDRTPKKQERDTDATQPMDTEGASSSMFKKRDTKEVDPDLGVEEEEPSSKQRLIGLLNSTEEFCTLGLFFSGNEDDVQEQEKDLFFIETMQDYCEEDKEVETLVNQLNLLANDRDKAVNPAYPVPAEMDISDEVRANVDWHETFYDTSGAELDPVMTKAAMQEEVNFM